MSQALRPAAASVARAVGLAAIVACWSCANGKQTPPASDRDTHVVTVTARSLSLGEARDALWPRATDVALRPATAAQHDALSRLVSALWRGVDADRPPPALLAWAQTAGFELEIWSVAGRRTWVVREAEDARRGGGAYLVRADAPPPGATILLQAPHVYFDVGTGGIAAGLFFAPDAPPALRGLYTNSIHRYQTEPGARAREEENPADVAHARDHLFQSATRAIVSRRDPADAMVAPVEAIIQIHGFDGEGYAEDPAATADAVVSAGRRDGSTPASSRVATGLAALGLAVIRFPEDTAVLGGTTNVQGELARELGVDFIHVELAASVRQRLRRDPESAAAWAGAFAQALNRQVVP
jgi:hypothetical protein